MPAIKQKEDDDLEPEIKIISDEESERKLNYNANCYVCKESFKNLHHFYHLMCPSCAILNFEKRTNKCDLSGKIALVTGGRTKIGFEIVVSLL